LALTGKGGLDKSQTGGKRRPSESGGLVNRIGGTLVGRNRGTIIKSGAKKRTGAPASSKKTPASKQEKGQEGRGKLTKEGWGGERGSQNSQGGGGTLNGWKPGDAAQQKKGKL